MKILQLLPWQDWLALTIFFAIWIGYTWFAHFLSKHRPSILVTTNQYRYLWMLQATFRDARVLDGVITQSLSTSPSFFASTTILIIGGLLALLGTTDKAVEFVRDIPFAQQTPTLVFEFKLLILITVFVYAFFRFTWSMRQYTFAALLIGAMPDREVFLHVKQPMVNNDTLPTKNSETPYVTQSSTIDTSLDTQNAQAAIAYLAGSSSDTASSIYLNREQFTYKASRLLGLAAETFNGGLRTYYLSFAVLAWFFNPWTFVLGSVAVVLILYYREFHSDVLHILSEKY